MGRLDSAVKHAIAAFPEHWARFIGVGPDVSVEVVDTDVSTISGATDKAMLIGADPPFLLHLEPQAYYDETLDERMHTYNALLRRRHRLPVHSAAIVLNRESWGAGNAGYVSSESPLGGCWLEFTFEVIRVWELRVERILSAGVGVLPLAPIAQVDRAAVPGVVQHMADRFGRELPRSEAAAFWTATYVLVGLKYDRAFAELLLRGVNDTMRESTTYQAILEEGMAEGRAKAKQDDLILLGTRRFEDPDARTLAAIRAISDIDRLDAMLLRILDAKGWDDVLAAGSEKP